MIQTTIQRSTVSGYVRQQSRHPLFLLILMKGRKLLNYDLNLLCEYARRRGLQKIVIAFKDSEALDGGLLTELIHLLRYVLARMGVKSNTNKCLVLGLIEFRSCYCLEWAHRSVISKRNYQNLPSDVCVENISMWSKQMFPYNKSSRKRSAAQAFYD